jgi:glycosyltransferase involved in cell wall biosynthesis
MENRELIQGRYTLLTHIPVFVTRDGVVRTDALWEKDLSLHLEYIPDLHVYCPVYSDDQAKTDLVNFRKMGPERFHHIPENLGWPSVVRNFWPHFRAMGRATKESEIINAAGAGWPFPLCFYLLFWRWFYDFKLVMIIESSFWRLEPGETGSLRQRFAHASHMWLIPKCLKMARARIFTHDEYRETLYGGSDACLVAPAVWYDTDKIETEVGLAARHTAAETRCPRVILPARLVPEKGILTVLDAVRTLASRRPDARNELALDIVGEGELKEMCRTFSATHEGPVSVRLLDPVPYGETFFALLRDYDALIVANRKGEQPRIAYDAFSQGVPVITSRTAGTLAVAEEGVTAAMFEVDDSEGLADALEDLVAHQERFRAYGRAALAKARTLTHWRMHDNRRKFLLEVL